MTVAEAARLLALAAAFDNRKPDTSGAAPTAWADALDDLDVDDCATAVRRHYRASTDFAMPAHVRRIVRDIRDERAREQQASWRALQPAPEECVSQAQIRATILEFSRKRALPADVTDTT
jgi:hypothetical protein